MASVWPNINKFMAFWKRYEVWDSTLYRLCRDFADHQDKAGVYAKVYLIGRSYQTGIERHAEDKSRQRKPLNVVADALHTNRRTVDLAIAKLRVLGEGPTSANLQDICEMHMRVLRVVKRVTRQNSNPWSFVSTYLHFHAPVVPIYDNVASIDPCFQ